MFATVRRYEGIDASHKDELTKKVGESLAPRLSKLPGFGGYYLIEDGKGTMSSFGLFDTATQADESSRVVSAWIRDEKFDDALPNEPKITTGSVIAHESRVAVTA